MSGWGTGAIDQSDEDFDDYEEPPYDWTPEEDEDEANTVPPPPQPGDVNTPDGAPEPEPIGGGLNLIPHSSFESAGDWQVGAGWTIPYRAQEVSPFHGTAIARAVGAGGVAPGEAVSPVVSVDRTRAHWFSAESWMQSLSGGTGRILLREFEADGDWLSDTTLIEVSAAEEYGWVRHSRAIVARTHSVDQIGWNPATASVQIVLQTTGQPTCEWWVDGLQLEIGNVQSVYEPLPGEDIDGSEIIPGTLPPETFDTTPPAVPALTAVRSQAQTDADGKVVVVLTATFEPPADEDYAGIEAEATRTFVRADPAQPESAMIPVWTPRLFDFLPKGDTDASFVVTAKTNWWVRGRSIDTQGNRSGYSAVVLHPTVGDGQAPALPAGLEAYGVYKGMVVSWLRSGEFDISYSEVRYRIKVSDATYPAEIPLVSRAEWEVFRTRSTLTQIEGLTATERVVEDAITKEITSRTATTLYEVEVRHVDTSGQVQTSDTNPIPIDATSAAGQLAGWIPIALPVAPLLVDGADIRVGSITAAQIKAGAIRADMISAGEININTSDDPKWPDGIIIRDGGHPKPDGSDADELGRWDEDGLVLYETPGEVDSYLKLEAGSLKIYKDNALRTAITTEGIDASLINFGVLEGGHNLIWNSSFELGGGVPVGGTVLDTAAADWTGSQVGSPVNLTAAATQLQMTTTGWT